jgi:hypothetical protein
LARTQYGGKIGFVNKKLNVIIQPQYDFGFPFQQGKAIVCNGCRPVQEGEHQQLTGGKWGALDRQGQIVIPLEYTRDELEKKLPLQK